MKSRTLLLCLAGLTLLTSCIKDADKKPNTGNGDAESFDFATSKQVKVQVNYRLEHNTRVEIYTQNPLTTDGFKNYVKNKTLKPLAVGYTDAEGRLSIPVRVAARDERIFVYSPSVGAPALLSAEITGESVTLGATDAVAPRKASASRAIADTDAYWDKWAQQTFSFRPNASWSWDAQGRPAYLLDEPMTLDAQTLNLIDAAIPKGEKFELINAQYSQIEISEDANVSLYFISNSSARRNAVAYFTYTDEMPSQTEINASLTLLFPNLSSEALKAGDGAMLERYDTATGSWSTRFPAGTKIGFVLLTDAWNDNGTVATTTHAVYSHKQFNRYDIPAEHSIMADRPHMAAFTANDHFILTFEDLPYYDNPSSKYCGDFSDEVFVMTANPITALPDVPSVDDSDVPPYVTSYEDYGILAFEDNWPYKGDYDLNDVVVKYDSKLQLNYDYDYNSIKETYTFLNNGGKYTNGFGIEYGFDLSALNLQKCSVTATAPDASTIEVPGFDTSLTEATLMLFADAARIPSGTTFDVTLVFDTPQLTLGFMLPPYNPFITVNDEGALRKEVHLVDHKPTTKADPQFFRYGHDLSGNGRYYISNATYPFAIDLSKAESYRLPSEAQCISDIYPRFDSWASSDGTRDKDWYFE